MSENGKQPTNPDRTPSGQFLPGNSVAKLGGRPKSSRHKLAEQFFIDLQEIWAASGKGVLRSVLDEKPSELMRAVAGLMPKELTVEMVDPETALRALDDEPATHVLPEPENGSHGDTGGAMGIPEGQP